MDTILMIFITLIMESFQDTNDGVKIKSQPTDGTHSNQQNMLNTNLLQVRNNLKKLIQQLNQDHQKMKQSNLNGNQERKSPQEESLMPMVMVSRTTELFPDTG
jgi:hypothetical protein